MENLFFPSRRSGLIFQGILLAFLGGGGGLAFAASLQQGIGSDLIFYLVLSVLLLLPTPLIIYHVYALLQASYTLDRDGLRIRWGLRAEDIPLPQIEWIRPADEMGFPLRMPLTATPGAFLGTTHVEGLGSIEFIGSDTRTLLLVATPKKVFAISPANPKAFVRSFRQYIELGSLSPLSSFSTRPVAFLGRVWGDRLARAMLGGGFMLTAALFVLIALRIPTLQSVSLGFYASALPPEPGPPESLLLLAVLGGFAFALDLVSGLFFYRFEDSRPVAYLMWGAGVAAPFLLLVGAVLTH